MDKRHGGKFYDKPRKSAETITHWLSYLEDNHSTLSSILQSHAALHHGVPTSAASGQQQIIQNSTAELNNQRRPVSTQGSPIKWPTPGNHSKTEGRHQSICEECQSTD